MVKPHFSYAKQLARLEDRGLDCGDRQAATQALKRIGYYRLSGYTYPFRKPLPDPPGVDRKGRSEQFSDGATLSNALALYEFDERLRSILFEALSTIEVGIAVRVADAIGRRNPMGHLDPACLDRDECDKLVMVESGTFKTKHQLWEDRYRKLLKDAKDEEFIKHHTLNYDGDVPVWVATGVMDFGCLNRLYAIMIPFDRRTVSQSLGLQRDSAKTLQDWLLALSILRNHCAHNNRVWNRSTIKPPPKFSTVVAPEELHHLLDLDNNKRQKLYYLAALVAYLVVEIDPSSTWPRRFADYVLARGSVGNLTPMTTMGFPDGWSDLTLWQAA